MRTILNTFICLTFFMLGWNIGVAFDNDTQDLTNVFILWGILLGLFLLRFKIKK